MSGSGLTRREGLGLAALATAAGAAPVLSAARNIDFVTRVDFKDPAWNRDTYARMDADLGEGEARLAQGHRLRHPRQREGAAAVRRRRLVIAFFGAGRASRQAGHVFAADRLVRLSAR